MKNGGRGGDAVKAAARAGPTEQWRAQRRASPMLRLPAVVLAKRPRRRRRQLMQLQVVTMTLQDDKELQPPSIAVTRPHDGSYRQKVGAPRHLGADQSNIRPQTMPSSSKLTVPVRYLAKDSKVLSRVRMASKAHCPVAGRRSGADVPRGCRVARRGGPCRGMCANQCMAPACDTRRSGRQVLLSVWLLACCAAGCCLLLEEPFILASH